MHYRMLIIATLAMVFSYACGGKDPAMSHPDAMPDAFESDCGFPGDMRSELGTAPAPETVHLCDALTRPHSRD